LDIKSLIGDFEVSSHSITITSDFYKNIGTSLNRARIIN